MLRQEWDQAARILADVVQRQPSNVDAWMMLGDAYEKLGDKLHLLGVVETLTRLQPDEPDSWSDLAMLSLVNEFPFSALHHAEHFLARWPNQEYADEVRTVQTIAETITEEILVHGNVTRGATRDDMIVFEQVQIALGQGDYKRAEQLALEVMQRLPQSVSPLNNLALAYLLQGRFEEAAKVARQALERKPGNIHALSHLVQLLFRMGQREEAQSVTRELRTQPLVTGVHFAKVLEALATMGDDAAVMEVYEQYERSPIVKETALPMIYHLAAVSYARWGDPQRAKTLWRRALKVAPHFELAQANLEDLHKPVAQRSGAWPYTLDHWFPHEWSTDLSRHLARAGSNQAAGEKAIKRFMLDRPYIEEILPMLLERGDPAGRQFALIMTRAAGLPALRDFALGQYGTDQERMDAAMRASELGLLPRGTGVPIFVRGQQQDLLLLGYEITAEPEPSTMPLAPQRLLEKAHEALMESRGVEAESITREALKLAPDHPNLLNFLFVALNLQHREEEAAAVADRTVELHPDYSFGRLAKAQLCINAGRYEEAHELMDPVLQKPRFHIAEFAALALTYAELLIAEEQFDGAESWLNILEQADPDDSRLIILRARLLAARVLKMPSQSKRRKAKRAR